MRAVFYLFLVLLLAGCGDYGIRKPVIENADDGAVVVRVVSNQAFVGFAASSIRAWEGLAVQQEIGGSWDKEYALAPVFNDSSLLTPAFVGSLPLGHYRVKRVVVAANGVRLTFNEHFGDFDVQPGKLTDLGTIVISEYRLVSHSPTQDPEDTKALIREAAPGLVTLLDRPMLSWRADSVSPAMEQAAHYALTYPYGRQTPQLTAEGDYLFGSVDGVVLRWSSSTKYGWTTYDLQQRADVSTVLPLQNGDWMAGGDLGLLKLSTDQGRNWQSVRGNLPLGATLDLLQWNDQVLATVLHKNEISIYSALPRSRDWKLLAKYDNSGKPPFDLAEWETRPRSILHGHLLITSLPSRRQVAVLDLDSGTSKQYDVPCQFGPMDTSPNDTTLRAGCFKVGAKLYESRDGGKTWTQSPSIPGPYTPSFKDDTHGISRDMVSFTSAPKLLYTEDGGHTWSESQARPRNVASMFWSRDGKTAYLFTHDGIIWTSTDNGKTWDEMQTCSPSYSLTRECK